MCSSVTFEVAVQETATTETDAASEFSGDAHSQEGDGDQAEPSFINQTADGDRGTPATRTPKPEQAEEESEDTGS